MTKDLPTGIIYNDISLDAEEIDAIYVEDDNSFFGCLKIIVALSNGENIELYKTRDPFKASNELLKILENNTTQSFQTKLFCTENYCINTDNFKAFAAIPEDCSKYNKIVAFFKSERLLSMDLVKKKKTEKRLNQLESLLKSFLQDTNIGVD